MKKYLLGLFTICLFTFNTQATTADFDIINVCEGDSTIFISTSTSSDSIIAYLWDLNGNGMFNDASGDTVKWYFPSGTYNVGLKIVTDVGGANALYQTLVITTKPIVDFSFTDLCFGDSVHFTNLTQLTGVGDSIINLLWIFGDTYETDLLEHPSHLYQGYGPYNVTLRALTANGCADSLTKIFSIIPLPPITLTLDGDTIFEGSSVTATVAQSYNSIVWSTGETGNSITINQGGKYSVTVTDTACSNTKMFDIVVQSIRLLKPMTLITPNGDNFNEYWEIENIHLCDQNKVTIYNRWGDMVYSTLNYQNDWNGDNLPEGTYYYIIECNEDNVFKGAINILR